MGQENSFGPFRKPKVAENVFPGLHYGFHLPGRKLERSLFRPAAGATSCAKRCSSASRGSRVGAMAPADADAAEAAVARAADAFVSPPHRAAPLPRLSPPRGRLHAAGEEVHGSSSALSTPRVLDGGLADLTGGDGDDDGGQSSSEVGLHALFLKRRAAGCKQAVTRLVATGKKRCATKGRAKQVSSSVVRSRPLEHADGAAGTTIKPKFQHGTSGPSFTRWTMRARLYCKLPSSRALHLRSRLAIFVCWLRVRVRVSARRREAVRRRRTQGYG
jgi:hypothetical protein